VFNVRNLGFMPPLREKDCTERAEPAWRLRCIAAPCNRPTDHTWHRRDWNCQEIPRSPSLMGRSCGELDVERDFVAVTYNSGPRHHIFKHLQTLQTSFEFQNVPIEIKFRHGRRSSHCAFFQRRVMKDDVFCIRVMRTRTRRLAASRSRPLSDGDRCTASHQCASAHCTETPRKHW
jgi:hypothetical protein